jgi:hypothetical protein
MRSEGGNIRWISREGGSQEPIILSAKIEPTTFLTETFSNRIQCNDSN